MGENVCKRCDQQSVNIQNIQMVHTTQYQKRAQSKNGQKTQVDIFPMKTYTWPTGTGKDAQHC